MKKYLMLISLIFIVFTISVNVCYAQYYYHTEQKRKTDPKKKKPQDIATLVSEGWDDTESQGVSRHGMVAGYSNKINVAVHEGYYDVDPKKLKEVFTLDFKHYFSRYLPKVEKVNDDILYATAQYGRYLVEAKLEIISDDEYKLYLRSEAVKKNEAWKNRLVQYLNKYMNNQQSR